MRSRGAPNSGFAAADGGVGRLAMGIVVGTAVAIGEGETAAVSSAVATATGVLLAVGCRVPTGRGVALAAGARVAEGMGAAAGGNTCRVQALRIMAPIRPMAITALGPRRSENGCPREHTSPDSPSLGRWGRSALPGCFTFCCRD